jgi:hypothetical protein
MKDFHPHIKKPDRGCTHSPANWMENKLEQEYSQLLITQTIQKYDKKIFVSLILFKCSMG